MNHCKKSLQAFFFPLFLLSSLYANPCNTTTKNSKLDISFGLNDYTLNISIPTSQGNQTVVLPPCPKGEWNPIYDCYCEDGNTTKKIIHDIQSTEFAPGIYGFNLNFSLKPTNQSNDIFCSRKMNNFMVIDYENQDNYAAFLLSAYKDQVLGILFGSFSAPDASNVIIFNQMPCNVWNSIVETNVYNGQGRYPACKNFTTNH